MVDLFKIILLVTILICFFVIISYDTVSLNTYESNDVNTGFSHFYGLIKDDENTVENTVEIEQNKFDWLKNCKNCKCMYINDNYTCGQKVRHWLFWSKNIPCKPTCESTDDNDPLCDKCLTSNLDASDNHFFKYAKTIN